MLSNKEKIELSGCSENTDKTTNVKKAETIEKPKQQELLEFEIFSGADESKPFAGVVGINNPAVQKVEIPQYIYFDDKQYQVEIISKCAFANCQKLETVILPPSIYAINEYAFHRCRSLKTIDLINVTKIGNNAFAGCENLEIISLHAEIGEEAFIHCTSIKNLELTVLPESVLVNHKKQTHLGADLKPLFSKNPDEVFYCLTDFIGDKAFNTCVGLERVKMGMHINQFITYLFIAYNKLPSDNKTASEIKVTHIEEQGLFCIEHKGEKHYMKPPKMIIGKEAFSFCVNLKQVGIYDIPCEIGDLAFAGCKSLASVELNCSVEVLSQNLFAGCESLEGLPLPRTLKKIKYGALTYGESLRQLHIPSSVTEIQHGAIASNALQVLIIDSSHIATNENTIEYLLKLNLNMEVFLIDQTIDNCELMKKHGFNEIPSQTKGYRVYRRD